MVCKADATSLVRGEWSTEVTLVVGLAPHELALPREVGRRIAATRVAKNPHWPAARTRVVTVVAASAALGVNEKHPAGEAGC
jgi:hypothetical protein